MTFNPLQLDLTKGKNGLAQANFHPISTNNSDNSYSYVPNHLNSFSFNDSPLLSKGNSS